MILGYCSWLLSGIKLPDIFEFLHDEGCGSVSILQSIMNHDVGEKREAAAVIKEHGMTLCMHGNVQGTLSKDGQCYDRDFMQHVIDEAMWWHDETDGKLFDFCTDALTYRSDDGTRYGNLPLSFEIFKKEAATFADSGIRFGLENSIDEIGVNGLYAGKEAFDEAFRQFGGIRGAGILFDIGHAFISVSRQSVDFEKYIDDIPFEIHELHVTDNFGKQDEHNIPGCGSLDFGVLRRALKKRNFNGPVNVEVCKDILHGLYEFDLSVSNERDTVKRALRETRKRLDFLE